MATGDDMTTAVLTHLEQLVAEMRAHSGVLGHRGFDHDDAVVAAMNAVWPVVGFVRRVMALLVPGLADTAMRLADTAVDASPVLPLLEPEEVDDFRDRCRHLVYDAMAAGVLNGGPGPDGWPPGLPSACVQAMACGDEFADRGPF
jgi:hypothetical protein